MSRLNVDDLMKFAFLECTNDKEKVELNGFMCEHYGDDWIAEMLTDGGNGELRSAWQIKLAELKGRKDKSKPKIWEEKEETSLKKLFQRYNEWPKVLQDLCNWSARNQVKPQPELAILSSLSAASGVLSRRYKTTTNVPASLYCLALALSGQGKEHGFLAIKELLNAADDSFRITGEPASSAAIYDGLSRNPALLMLIDEFADALEVMADKRTNKYQAKKELLKVFGAHSGRYYTDTYSKKGKSLEEKKEMYAQEAIWNPEIGIYAGTTPNSFWRTVNSDTSASGLLNRFLVLFSTLPRQKSGISHNDDIPESWINWSRLIKQRWRAESNGFSDNPFTPANLVKLKISKGAWDLLDRFGEMVINQQNMLDDQGLDDFYARTEEKAIRVALIIQLMENFESTEISVKSMQWGIDFVWHCDSQLLGKAAVDLSDSDYGRMVSKCLQKIRAAKREGLTRSQICTSRPFRDIPSKVRNEMLQSLLDSEQVVRVQTVSSAGRSVTTYFALEWCNEV